VVVERLGELLVDRRAARIGLATDPSPNGTGCSAQHVDHDLIPELRIFTGDNGAREPARHPRVQRLVMSSLDPRCQRWCSRDARQRGQAAYAGGRRGKAEENHPTCESQREA
jgi:hypothetical protein